jgi:hypothetical protein
MTSLKSALPSPGSITWRWDPGADDKMAYDIRVRHVTITDAVISVAPLPTWCAAPRFLISGLLC